MRTGRVGRGLGVTAVTVVVALGAATACGAAGKSPAADPTTSATGPPSTTPPASTTGPPSTTGPASTTLPASTTGPPSSASAEPTVPPPLAATDNGSLAGTWVADNGDVLDFVRTAPGMYHGTVLFASHCAPDAGPVVVSSQGPGRYVGTGPLESGGAGWCGAQDPVSPVTIVVATGGSTARVAAETWTRTTFAVHGNIPPPGPNDEDQAVGSPALAQTCDKSQFDSYKVHGSLIATSFKLGRAPSAAALLTHFLEGTGTAVDYPPGSAVAGEAASSPAFEQEDQRVQGYVVSRLNHGATRIDPGDGPDVLNTIDFADQSMRDLYLSFRNTQGITVTGVGAVVGSEYVGELTYVIQDAYGFGVHDYLLGAGAEMRYLQRTCGAPYYPGGAHWFPDSVTVTVGLRMPVGAAA